MIFWAACGSLVSIFGNGFPATQFSTMLFELSFTCPEYFSVAAW